MTPESAPSSTDLNQLDQWSYHRVLDDVIEPCLVVFTSPACGSCRALLRALPDVPLALIGARYQIDAARWPGLAEEMAVFHLPAMLLYARGELVGEVHAPPRAAALSAAIEALLSSDPQFEPAQV